MQNFLRKSLSNDGRINCESKTTLKILFEKIKRQILHRLPNLSSAVAWALSWSFLITHWYIPLSSFLTDSMRSTASEWSINFPSFIHRIVLIGFPVKWHVKMAGRPKSIVCAVGSIDADNGAVTVKTDNWFYKLFRVDYFVDDILKIIIRTCFHTFTSDRIVNNTQVFSRIVNYSILDYQSSWDLLDTFSELNWCFPCCSFDELVPSEENKILVHVVDFESGKYKFKYQRRGIEFGRTSGTWSSGIIANETNWK